MLDTSSYWRWQVYHYLSRGEIMSVLSHFPTGIFTSRHISHNFRINYISRLHALMHFTFLLSLTRFLHGNHPDQVGSSQFKYNTRR